MEEEQLGVAGEGGKGWGRAGGKGWGGAGGKGWERAGGKTSYMRGATEASGQVGGGRTLMSGR